MPDRDPAIEYEAAAEHLAWHGEMPDVGVDTADSIAADPEAFAARVRAYRYARAMGDMPDDEDAGLDELRRVAEALCGEFESAVAHAEWRSAGSKGMQVPFHGDFAAATQLPSVVGRMRWWSRELRRALGKTVAP